MYKLVISPKALKELKKIKKAHQVAINLIFQEIKEEPSMGKPLTREFSGRFSYRIGVYRIIYMINKQNKVINILTTGHRSTVYH